MTNNDIAKIFSQIASILEIKDENRFKIRAYENAAETIAGLPQELASLYKENDLKGLQAINGIGKDLSLKIEELLKRGSLKYFKELKKEVPPGLLIILEIEGMGPRKTAYVWKNHGVQNVKQLKKLARGDKLLNEKGWGQKTLDNILRGIDLQVKYGERIPLGIAYPIAQSLKEMLTNSGLADQVEIAGSLRRTFWLLPAPPRNLSISLQATQR
jgi:DNA polymerase (family X)